MKRFFLVAALFSTGCNFQSALEKCIDAGWCADVDGGPESDAGIDGGTDASVQLACGLSGWCWLTPTPRVNWREVISVSPTDAWAFGENGAAMHFDGTSWQPINGRTDDLTTAIWLGPQALLVGSTSGLLLLDAGVWTTVNGFAGLAGVQALGRESSGEFFATTGLGQNWHRSLSASSGWTRINTAPCQASDFAFPPGGLGWAACAGGEIRKHTDAGWVAQPTPTTEPLLNIWASSPDDAWASGNVGKLLHFNGTRWDELDAGPTSSVFGASRATDDVWLISSGGQLIHWDGTSFQSMGSLDFSGYGISLSANDGWAVGGEGRLARLQEGAWVEWPVGPLNYFWSIHGLAADDVWAVGSENTAVHFDGVRWTEFPVPRAVNLYGVFEHAPNDVWTVGQSGVALHWNGQEWAPVAVEFSGDLTGVWVDGTGIAWIVGSAGTLRRATPGGAQIIATPVTTDFSDVWGAGRDLWASAHGGQVMHCNLDDAGCQTLPPPGPQDLVSIYGSSPSDVWVAAIAGEVFQWNGATWTQRLSVPGTPLHTIRGDGSPAGGVNVVGGGGLVHHFGRDAGTSPTPVGTSLGILSIFSTADGGVTFVGGEGGALLRRGR